MAQIPGSTLAMFAKPFMPLAKKRAAGYAADYLNNRRQARLAQSWADVEGETIDPEVLAVLCERRARANAEVAKRLPWPMVLIGFIGAGIGAAVSYVLLNRGRQGNF
jgi:hypothetical protein